MKPTDMALAAQADTILIVAALLRGPGSADVDPAACLAALPALCTAANLPDASLVALAAQGALALAATPQADWIAEHATLFESRMQAPPNECAYIRRDKGQIMADIAGFYQAFGRELDTRFGERLDHVACELEFVGLLLVMRALAQREGDGERDAVVAQALQLFVSEHLGEWLPAFWVRLQAAAVLPLHQWLTYFLAALWCGCCRAHGWPDPAARDTQPPLLEEEPDAACGVTCRPGPCPA